MSCCTFIVPVVRVIIKKTKIAIWQNVRNVPCGFTRDVTKSLQKSLTVLRVIGFVQTVTLHEEKDLRIISED